MRESDLDRLTDILQYGTEAIGIVGTSSLADLSRDRLRCLATERLLEVVGEAASHLTEEARDQVDAEWRHIRGLRNLLAHRYRSVDHALLFDIVRDHLRPLVQEIRRVLPD